MNIDTEWALTVVLGMLPLAICIYLICNLKGPVLICQHCGKNPSADDEGGWCASCVAYAEYLAEADYDREQGRAS